MPNAEERIFRPELEARVLICDPHKKIASQIPEIQPILRIKAHKKPPEEGIVPFTSGNVEYTFTPSMDVAVNDVLERPAPYYSIVIYCATEARKEGAAGRIADVRKHDFFLPQMVIGGGIKPTAIGHCARGGVHYFAQNIMDAKDQLDKIFMKSKKIPNLTVVKIGGSAFDFDDDIEDMRNLERVCQTLVDIHKDREYWEPKKDGSGFKKKRRVNRMIVTVGAGGHGDVEKRKKAKYFQNRAVQENFPKIMAHALELNLNSLKPLIGDRAALLSTGAFYFIKKHPAAQRIPLIGTAPHYIMARDGIPLQDSDTHTIALAEFFGAERVVLIKRTDGIYDYDPYRGFVLDPATMKCADYDNWLDQQQENKRHEVVTIDEMLSGSLLRIGTGRNGLPDGSAGHLMEDSALIYMRDKCQHVKEVVVVHIAPKEMYCHVEDNHYLHVVTGDDIKVDPAVNHGWREILEKSIKDAFLYGKANSKIVRG
jgi:isopentenyl phosphate kinase